MNRKTCETVNASTVDAIPKRTSSAVHVDGIPVEVVGAAPADISADYERPVDRALERFSHQ
jgi:hypothetical protein